MAKVQFSDVTPPEKRSIRDIPIPSGGKRKTPIIIKPNPAPQSNFPTASTESSLESKPIEVNKDSGPYEYYYPKEKKVAPQTPPIGEQTFPKTSPVLPNSPNIIPQSKIVPRASGGAKSKKKKFVFGILVLIVIGVFIVGMMTSFSSATIVVTPKSQNVDVDLTFPVSVEKADGAVRYEVVKLSKSKTASVPATGEEVAEIKASGKIVVYNNFSTESQRLIVRTRFETADGLIYRIPESITVPGKSVKNGVETPGSIEVEVFADEVGEKYNIKKTDFTIPGFKTDVARYKGFYARSVTDMNGGFVGKRKTVTAADKQTALTTIDGELQDILQKELQAKVPDGLALLPEAILYESVELLQKESPESNNKNVEIGKEVTAYGILLNSDDLSQMMVKKYITSPDWTNIQAEVKDFSGVQIIKKPSHIESGAKIELQVSGKAKVQAAINSEVVSQKLAGVSRKNTAQIMDEFAGVSSITAAIRPIWKQSFPTDTAKIKVQMAP